MSVYIVQTEYYGWILGVFSTENDAHQWVRENEAAHPKETLRVRTEEVRGIEVPA